MIQMGAVHLLMIIGVVALVTVTDGRKSSKLQPAPVLGYQTHKGGPVISMGDKENIIVGDDADADGDDVEDLYRISVERNRVDNDDDDAARSRAPIRNGLDRFGAKQEPHDERKLVGLVMSLSERVAALQHTLGNIKLQNHYIYRTIKKGYKSCKESANDSAIKVAAQKIEKPKCPLGYVVNPDMNMCYKLAAERITWRMARERCRMEDADLVTIETKLEQRWINQLARQSPDTRHCDFWTGATDKYAEGDWRWVANNNALSYSNWNHNEPNNGRGDEHCMQMLWVFNWAWNDAKCNYNNACYICEIPLGKI